MVKIAYNACAGGFLLSDKAIDLINKRRKDVDDSVSEYLLKDIRNISRHDPILISVIEELGDETNIGNKYSLIKIKEIPDICGTNYRIKDCFGYETIIFEPAQFIKDKLKLINLQSLSDRDCRIILGEIISMLD